ncbi:MAG: hypothetical protein LAO19_00175 [Acidobacteriia bacterium]|nr:hypothetical protein [Terriglobia bacterium]
MVIHIPKGPHPKTYAREDAIVKGDSPAPGVSMSAKPTQRASKAFHPIRPVVGGGYSARLEHTVIPELPESYPINLKPQTDLILAKAGLEFPVQTQIQKYCRYVISKLKPHFLAAVEDKTLRADEILDIMNRVLRRIAIFNAETSEDQYRIAQEAKRSDEWLELAEGVERVVADVCTGGPVGPAKRLNVTIGSPIAARRMEAYLESKGIGLTEFASRIGTTDRTLRTFRKTGRVRRDIFEAIAKAMGTTKETLLKSE